MAAVVSKAVDAASVLLSLTIVVAVPLVDSQVVLPRSLYPAPLVRVQRWFAAEFDHYLVADPPPFFRGLVWLALAFLWPVCVANLYAIVTRRRRWVATTSLMAGVYLLTYLLLVQPHSDSGIDGSDLLVCSCKGSSHLESRSCTSSEFARPLEAWQVPVAVALHLEIHSKMQEWR